VIPETVLDAETASHSGGRTTGFRRLPGDNSGCNLHILLLSCSPRCRRDSDSAQLRSRPSRVAGFSSKDKKKKEIPSGSKRQMLQSLSFFFFIFLIRSGLAFVRQHLLLPPENCQLPRLGPLRNLPRDDGLILRPMIPRNDWIFPAWLLIN
jgi:hypothetical protein